MRTDLTTATRSNISRRIKVSHYMRSMSSRSASRTTSILSRKAGRSGRKRFSKTGRSYSRSNWCSRNHSSSTVMLFEMIGKTIAIFTCRQSSVAVEDKFSSSSQVTRPSLWKHTQPWLTLDRKMCPQKGHRLVYIALRCSRNLPPSLPSGRTIRRKLAIKPCSSTISATGSLRNSSKTPNKKHSSRSCTTITSTSSNLASLRQLRQPRGHRSPKSALASFAVAPAWSITSTLRYLIVIGFLWQQGTMRQPTWNQRISFALCSSKQLLESESRGTMTMAQVSARAIMRQWLKLSRLCGHNIRSTRGNNGAGWLSTSMMCIIS